ERVAVLLAEIRHARLDELDDRRRDLDVADLARRRPRAVGALRDELALAQASQDLEHEERVAVGLDADAPGELLGEMCAPQRVGEKPHEVLRPETRERAPRRGGEPA